MRPRKGTAQRSSGHPQKDRSLTSFHDLGLAEPIRRALIQDRYVTPTPIQLQAIPVALSGRDVIGIAQTGTGKTAAFALPLLHRLFVQPRRPAPRACRVLVLSPTRELSGQIRDSFCAYGRHLHLSTALAIGGVPMGRQVRALRNGVEVLIATPGRLLDLVRGNALRLGDVEFLVLDEADRMLDMGFINDIRRIVALIPPNRQTLFFSATMPSAVTALADQMLRNPARIAVTPVASTVERVDQRIIRVDRASKVAVLAKVLRHKTIDRALVFTRTKRGADKVVRSLLKAGIPAEAMHGNKSQNQRDRALAAFRSGEIRTLVATDIAARGIDIDGISHVVNFDLPDVPETYVHRIGRTARAGADGIAISLCDAEEVALVRNIEKLIRMSIPATDQRTKARQAQPSATQGGEGRPIIRAPKPRRNEARHRQDAERQPAGYRQQPDPQGGPASVALMHRDGRSSRKLDRDPRADKAQKRSDDRLATPRVLRG